MELIINFGLIEETMDLSSILLAVKQAVTQDILKEKVLIQIWGKGRSSPLAPFPPIPKFQRPCVEYEDDDDDETTVAVAVRHIVQKL